MPRGTRRGRPARNIRTAVDQGYDAVVRGQQSLLASLHRTRLPTRRPFWWFVIDPDRWRRAEDGCKRRAFAATVLEAALEVLSRLGGSERIRGFSRSRGPFRPKRGAPVAGRPTASPGVGSTRAGPSASVTMIRQPAPDMERPMVETLALPPSALCGTAYATDASHRRRCGGATNRIGRGSARRAGDLAGPGIVISEDRIWRIRCR